MGYTLPNEPGSWGYRVPVTYSNAGGATKGLQINILLDSTFNYNACLSGGVDVRITDSDQQTILPYFIESWNPGTSASIWFKVDLADTSNHVAYLYYGNASGTPIAPAATPVPPVGPFSHSDTYITTSGTAVTAICPENIILVGGTYYCVFENRTSGEAIALMHTSDPTLTTGWAFDSNVIPATSQSPFLYFDGASTYYIFYWNSDNTIHYATASVVTGPYTDQGTILSKGGAGAWDSAAVYEAGLIPNYDGLGNFALVYTGSGGAGPSAGNEQVGLATAPAVTGPYTKHGTAPIIPVGLIGSIDYQYAADSWYGGKYNGLHYIGYTAGPATANLGEPWGQSYVTTPDWVTFTKSNKMTFAAGAASRWDAWDAHRGHPLQVGSQWVQLYCGCASGNVFIFQAGVMLAPASVVQDIRNNADYVFNFWDGFDGSSLNLKKWSVGSNLTITLSGSIADISGTGLANGGTTGVAGSTGFPKNVVCESYLRFKSACTSGSTNTTDFGLGEGNVLDNSFLISAENSVMQQSYFDGGAFVGWNTISGAPFDTTNYHKAQMFWDGTTVSFAVDGFTATATPANITYNTAFSAVFFLYRGTALPELLVDWVRIRNWPGHESSVSLGPVQFAPTGSGSGSNFGYRLVF